MSGISLNRLYRAVGVSKQAVLKRERNEGDLKLNIALTVHMLEKIRTDHPAMGLRELYFKISPEWTGRDRFEKVFSDLGYGVMVKKGFPRTTDSSGVKRFPNLMADMVASAPNQLWCSDITYFDVAGKFHFLTFVQDYFTKEILGHSVADNLSTESTTAPALRMAIQSRRGKGLAGLVFHSDGGGQYYQDGFLALTGKHGMKNSMAKESWQNPMAESLNNVIKNRYLAFREIRSFKQLSKEVARVVQLYNHDKPHSSLKRKTPVQFKNEWYLCHPQQDVEVTGSFDTKKEPAGASPR